MAPPIYVSHVFVEISPVEQTDICNVLKWKHNRIHEQHQVEICINDQEKSITHNTKYITGESTSIKPQLCIINQVEILFNIQKELAQ